DSLSDCLCRLVTGAGFATRELWSDDSERLFSAQRPILLNGIEDLGTRADLLDRCVNVHLPSIPDSERKSEAELWARFEAARPRILGALLHAVAVALGRLPSVRIDGLPRMADFTCWAVAAEPALGVPPGSFLAAYRANSADAVELA